MANTLHVAAAVDRWDRPTDEQTEGWTPYHYIDPTTCYVSGVSNCEHFCQFTLIDIRQQKVQNCCISNDNVMYLSIDCACSFGYRLSKRYLTGWRHWLLAAMALAGLLKISVSSEMHGVEMLVFHSHTEFIAVFVSVYPYNNC